MQGELGKKSESYIFQKINYGKCNFKDKTLCNYFKIKT